MSELFTELKRRNVFRVAIVYLIAGWIILQVADVMAEALAVTRQALQIDPQAIFALSLLAYLDLGDERDLGALDALAEALPDLGRPLVEVDSLSAEQTLLLAALMLQAGQTDQAARIATAAEKAFRHMQSQAMPQFHAQTLVLLGREAEAAAVLRQAIKTRSLGPARWSVLRSPIFENMRMKDEYQDIFAAIVSDLDQQRALYVAERDTR
jgi:predicted Zn-dependent protease